MARPSSFHKVNAEIGHRLTRGVYLTGQRLEADPIADELGTSSSPVRQAFYWRVGEGLLHYNVMGGFNVPVPTERGLKQMFDWQGVMGALALSEGLAIIEGTHIWRSLSEALSASPDPVFALDQFLRAVGQLHRNREVHRDYNLITARLAPAQYVRHGGRDPLETTLRLFQEAVESQNPDALISALAAYYRRTSRLAPSIVETCQTIAATINK